MQKAQKAGSTLLRARFGAFSAMKRFVLSAKIYNFATDKAHV